MSSQHIDLASNESALNVDKAVKFIVLENEKCGYNPQTDMNWDILPMEMRLECVKRMDFKTRIRLGATSQVEKSLVEARKYQFEAFKIFLEDGQWYISAQTYSKSWDEIEDVVEENGLDYGCIAAILKHAEVKNFQLGADDFDTEENPPNQEHLAKFAPFGFKRVSVFYKPASTAFFLKNCPNLEKVDYHGVMHQLPLTEILKAQSLMNVKEFKFANVCSEDLIDFLEELVQKWIDNDVGIGKSLQFSMESWTPIGEAISVFAEKFSDRVIEKTDKEVRIRMNSNTKQILLRQIGITPDEEPGFDPEWEYCSCKVIPIDMPKSEYKIGDGWIQAVYERTLKGYGILENAAEFDAEDEKVWGKEVF